MNKVREIITVVGLGYVGLPLALRLATKFEVNGVDENSERVRELKDGYDRTGESTGKELLETSIKFSEALDHSTSSNVYIVTVPTPVDEFNVPDFTALKSASTEISKILGSGDLVIYESTVYPGATREICVPILENGSGLILNRHFHVGYSPERINPGDANHQFEDIVKVVAGSNAEALDRVDALYSQVVRAGTHRVSSLEVAEAAKVIENTQRDVNIALVNEISQIFHTMNLDSSEVLDAACTKWNFLNFRPGLVGGHCIGVDPYYLTHKASKEGHVAELITAGRRINNDMPRYLGAEIAKRISRTTLGRHEVKVLMLGITFKEDCPDVRNSKICDLCSELGLYGYSVDVFDPVASAGPIDEALMTSSFTIIDSPIEANYQCVILGVPHKVFTSGGVLDLKRFGSEGHLFVDLKSAFDKTDSDFRL